MADYLFSVRSERVAGPLGPLYLRLNGTFSAQYPLQEIVAETGGFRQGEPVGLAADTDGISRG